MNREQRRAADAAAKRLASTGAVDLAQQVKAKSQQLKHLFVAWMYGDQARPSGAWVNSLLSLAQGGPELGFAIRPVAVETGPVLDRARNVLLASFLRSEGFDYLLFADTDIVFEPKDVKLLLDASASIAGALYFTAATGEDPHPVPLRRRDDGQYAPVSLPEPPESLEEASPEEQAAWVGEALLPSPVDAVGMGLTLITRKCAEDMAAAHERPFAYDDGLGEDIVFCARAAALGHTTLMVPMARVGHIKAAIL